MYPKKKWIDCKVDYKGGIRSHLSEDSIQSCVNDYLKLKRVDFIRFPDSFFRWIKMMAPPSIQKWFFGMFGGRPDNICIIPISDGIALALLLEIKTESGRLHGKQKHHEKEWKVCRSVEDAIEVINKFIEKAGGLKLCL